MFLYRRCNTDKNIINYMECYRVIHVFEIKNAEQKKGFWGNLGRVEGQHNKICHISTKILNTYTLRKLGYLYDSLKYQG